MLILLFVLGSELNGEENVKPHHHILIKLEAHSLEWKTKGPSVGIAFKAFANFLIGKMSTVHS